jgi:hypothetical protein
LTAGTVEDVSTGRVVGDAVSTKVTGVVELVVSATVVGVVAWTGAVVVTSATVTAAAVGESSEHAEHTPSRTIARAATRFTWASRRRAIP